MGSFLKLNHRINRQAKALAAGLWVVPVLLLTMGCETQSFFDPSEVGRFDRKPLVVPILKTLDTGIEERDERFVNAGGVKPADLVAQNTDYVIGANDLLQVSIADLVAPNVESAKTMRVSQSGFISLPLIGQVKATGLTEAQLEQAISQAYADRNLIKDAQVSVVTIEARSRTFSIFGAVTQAGQYAIVDADFRLMDALVLARDVTQPVGIDYIYVVRRAEHDVTEAPGTETTAPAPMVPSGVQPATQPTPDVLTPRSQLPVEPKMMMQDVTPPTTAPAAGSESHIIVVDDKPMQIEGGQPVPSNQMQPGNTTIVQPDQTVMTTQPFEFNDLKEPAGVRVIRVPFEDLKRGELKYNIVIRPQDFIWVPQPSIGEYYMMGHVQRTGVYSLSARNISLMQAIAGAGGLDQLAIPQRTQIVRRLSTEKQVFARVDLEKIFNGQEPDIMLKPDDQVLVGTNALAPFLAAFRSGFRLTYGFGFIYDRNYWEQNNQ
ncbi:MAG TPA: polysaccharide biosynthesis/export family protein [Tepidisphaeraceae bacterium]